MRRTLISLTTAAAAAVALTGCVVFPPVLDPYAFGFSGGYAPYDPAYEEIDLVAEEQWQAENRASELDFAEAVAEELRATGSQVPPPEGESLEEFRHVAGGVGLEWCDRIWVDESRIGDEDEHAEHAARYGWTPEEYRIVAEAAETELCGY